MSESKTPDSGYIYESSDGSVEILEDAYVNADTINKFKFEFNKGNDITNSLKKNNKLSLNDIAETTPHRTGYSAGKCVYPNGKQSAMIMLENVIIQYREGLEKSETTDYGKDYVCIGFPLNYIVKITKDSKSSSSINTAVREKFKNQEGHYWIDCSLKSVPIDQFYVISANGEGTPINLQSALRRTKTSFVATILTSLSASIRNNDLVTPLDLINGTYYLTFKPTEVYLQKTSTLQGPKLDNTNARKKEKASVTEKLVADEDLIARLKGL